MDYELEINNLNKTVLNLTKRIEKLEEKNIKKKKAENKSKVDVYQIKLDFFESKPKERNDPFQNFELVLYSSLLYNENRATHEKIETMAELAKRTKKMQNVVNFFLEIAQKIKVKKPEEWARKRTKEFIEYVIKIVEKNWKDEYITYWLLTSDWCLNTYGSAIKDVNREKELAEMDKEL